HFVLLAALPLPQDDFALPGGGEHQLRPGGAVVDLVGLGEEPGAPDGDPSARGGGEDQFLTAVAPGRASTPDFGRAHEGERRGEHHARLPVHAILPGKDTSPRRTIRTPRPQSSRPGLAPPDTPR